MSTDDGTLFLALLALAAATGTLVLWIAVAVSAISRGDGPARHLLDAVGRQALALAALVAVTATAGSLWLSEGAGFPPCKLCWYQRIAMYPLAVVLTIAAVRRDDRARLSGIVLALGGAAVSVWHVLIEHYPSLSSSSTCDPTNPCSIRWVEEFGFLTIPTMALIGFLTITTLLLLPHPPDDDPALEASA